MTALDDHDAEFLTVAIDQARVGASEGGVPIGAALVADGVVLGVGHNRRLQRGSPIHHDETDALEQAGRQPATVYGNATMYTTVSACHMSAGAVLLCKIPRVVVGEHHTFVGAEALLRDHGVEVIVADDDRCVELMRAFIAERPDVWNEDIGEP